MPILKTLPTRTLGALPAPAHRPPCGRADSDSDSDSDSEGGFGEWGKSDSDGSDSDSDDEVVMESKSDKQKTALLEVQKKLANARKINDWVNLQKQFEQLNKEMEQINRVASFHTAIEVARQAGLKRLEIDMLLELEEFLAECLKDGVEPLKASMKKPNYQALSNMRQLLKKHMRDPERVRQVASHRVQYQYSERENVSPEMICLWLTEHLLDQYAGAFQKAGVNGVTLLELDEEKCGAMKLKPAETTRLLKEVERIQIILDHEGDDDWDPTMLVGKNDDAPGKPGEEKTAKKPKAKKFDPVPWWVGEGVKPEDVTDKMIEEQIIVILGLRGKRGTDLKTQIKAYSELLKPESAGGGGKVLEIRVQLVSAMFDCINNLSTGRAVTLWRDTQTELMALINHINETGVVLEEGEVQKTVDEFSEAHEVAAYMEQMEEEGKVAELPQQDPQAGDEDGEDEEGPQPVLGNLGNFMEQLSGSFFKSMQNLKPETMEYILRLKDEDLLMETARAVQAYYVKVEKPASVARVAALQIEQMYYKHESVEWAKAAAAGQPKPNPKNAIHELALAVYRDASDDRTKTRTMLCQIYHHALHDRFYVARDMLLMSRQQENIQYEDISTQILFNRMMVQLGLAAFRLGMVQQAHDCLTEVAGSARGDPTWRNKELLAQGITTRGHRPQDAEREKLERRRQMPYHMHIDLDLIEACHMTSAMLLEVPAIAAAGKQERREVISKTFMRYLEHYEKSWHGPPESTRETVLFTAATVARGDWEKTSALLTGLPCWNTAIMGGEEALAAFKARLTTNIQEATLRTYLHTYGAQYDSLSLVQLAGMFGLEENRVHSIVSALLHEEAIAAA